MNLTCDLDLIKTKDRARQGSSFKKQNQQFSYQRKCKLPDQKFIYGQGYAKNSSNRYFKKPRQPFSYQKRNKLQHQKVFYGQGRSENSLGRFFNKQNQQFSY